jgi:catechol 2,3-dioxygenase-like lactoylglutathione lyase family enzyme
MRVSEVVLHTTNFETMREWYMGLLGAAPAVETPLVGHPQIIRLAFFRLHIDYPYTQMLALFDVRGEDEPASATRGLDHVQLRHGSIDDLFDRHDRLVSLGMHPEECMNHGPGTSFYYHDPDGNKVELSAANFPTVEEYLAFMDSPEFAANPSGVAIDVADYIARYRSGTPLSELVRIP